MKDKKNICLNCGQKLEQDDKYCVKCGKKSDFQNLNLNYLFKSFFDSFLNFDIRFFKSLKDSWIPNRLVNSFLSGKRSVYIHPFRYMFISLVIFFGLISISLRNFEPIPDDSMEVQMAKYDVYKRFLLISDSLKTEENAFIYDTITQNIFKNEIKFQNDTFINDTLLGVDFSALGMSTEDVFRLDNETLFKKYDVQSWKNKFIINQSKRIANSPNASIRFVIANMSWGFILLTLLLAAVLKLLYIRHDTYYAEHLLQMTHFHINLFLSFSLLLFIRFFIKVPTELFIVGSIIPVIYLFISLKLYFNQGLLMTFSKFVLWNMAYFAILLMIILLIGALSLMFF